MIIPDTNIEHNIDTNIELTCLEFTKREESNCT